MKLSDFLSNIGRPVAFYPGLAKAFGGIKPAVFVCQMTYWKDKGDSPDGWIYKTSDEIEAETALTYKEQTAVRTLLVLHKVLEERYARTEHQMYFRINWDVLNAVWDEYITNGKVLEHPTKSKVASSNKSGGSLPKGVSLSSNTDSTQKNTQKKKVSTPKQPKEKKESTPQPAEILLFKEVAQHYPTKTQRELVVAAIQKITVRLGRETTPEDLRPFWLAWANVSRNEWSLVWLTDWAVPGFVPNGKGKQTTPAPQPKQDDPDVIEKLRRKAQEMFFPNQEVTA
jgi:hypothetical protein